MLTVGERAPEFELKALDGKRYALNDRLTLIIFFKTNCPTCQYAWPFYERLETAYKQAGLQVWGISQHNKDKTRQFATEYHANFPLLIDADLKASRQYGPDFVPTGFLVDARRTILATFASWNKEQFIELAQQIAIHLQVAPQPLIAPTENVIAFKPG